MSGELDATPELAPENNQAHLQYSNQLERDIKSLLRLKDGLCLQAAPQLDPVRANWPILVVVSEFLVTFLSRFSRKDPLGRDSFLKQANKIQLISGNGKLARLLQRVNLYRIERSKWFRKRVAPCWWPFIILATWTCVIVHLLMVLVVLYRHDKLKFRVYRVRWLNESHPEQFFLQRLETELELHDRLVCSQQLVQWFWDGQTHASFITQCYILTLIILSVLLYPAASIYYSYRRPLSFDHLIEMFDYQQASKNCRRLINAEVKLFIKSHRTFTRALMKYTEKFVGQQVETVAACDNKIHHSALENSRQPIKIIKDGASSCATGSGGDYGIGKPKLNQQLELKLKSMLLRGHLTPVGLSPDRVRHNHLLYILTIVGTLLAQPQVIHIILNWLFQAEGERSDSSTRAGGSSFKRLLIGLELVFLLLVGVFACLPHAADVLLSCSDQIFTAKQLLEAIRKLVQLNTIRFYSGIQSVMKRRNETATEASLFVVKRSAMFDLNVVLTTTRNVEFESQQSSICQLVTNMNDDLLLVIMHYRIFIRRQLVLIDRLSALTLWLVSLLFLIPLLGRLHHPYLMGTSLTPLIGLYLELLLLPITVCIVPICYMHRRCLDLAIGMSSVVAHVAEISSCAEGRDIYDRHQVSTLCKQLSHHEGLASRLATKFAGISMTYPNLVRIYLYLGFLLVTLTGTNTKSEQELSVTIFSDPFRLF